MPEQWDGHKHHDQHHFFMDAGASLGLAHAGFAHHGHELSPLDWYGFLEPYRMAFHCYSAARPAWLHWFFYPFRTGEEALPDPFRQPCPDFFRQGSGIVNVRSQRRFNSGAETFSVAKGAQYLIFGFLKELPFHFVIMPVKIKMDRASRNIFPCLTFFVGLEVNFRVIGKPDQPPGLSQRKAHAAKLFGIRAAKALKINRRAFRQHKYFRNRAFQFRQRMSPLFSLVWATKRQKAKG